MADRLRLYFSQTVGYSSLFLVFLLGERSIWDERLLDVYRRRVPSLAAGKRQIPLTGGPGNLPVPRLSDCRRLPGQAKIAGGGIC